MPRLFLALDLPDSIKAQLLPLQKLAPAGAKRVPLANMHITLVFIGKAELEPVHQALNQLHYPPVSLTLSEPGCFKQHTGSHFWVGLRENTGLQDLQQRLLQALRQAGLQPDDKTFRPHITLARHKGALSEDARRAFLSQRLASPAPGFRARYFCLYRSETLPEGPIYHEEHRYALPEE